MNTLVYITAAVLCGVFGLRAWRLDRRDPARQAYLILAALLCITYLGFSAYLVGELPGFRYAPVAGAFIPAAALGFIQRWRGEQSDPLVRQLWLLTPPVCVAFVAIDATLFIDVPRASVAEVVLGIYVFGTLGVVLWRTQQLRNRTPFQLERQRLNQLLILMGAAVGLTGLEFLVRSFAPAIDLSALGPLTRSVLVQGVFPPAGAATTTLWMYFLLRCLEVDRLLGLQVVFSRVFTLAVLALLLLGVDGLAVIWVQNLTDYPVHVAFQLFLAGALFLAIYDPVRERVESLSNEWFNREARRLEITLDEVDRGLTKVISFEGLERQLLGRLQASGRTPLVTLYLWDQERGLYRRKLQQGQPKGPLLEQIAGKPFTNEFRRGNDTLLRTDLERVIRRDAPGADEAAERLRMMDAMEADATLGILSGDIVLGWLNVRSEAPFSFEELRRLRGTIMRTAVILENIHGFEQLEEQHRLVAMGTMAAGLAHEIRNPLAGIKGAAQYLQGERESAEVGEFIGVIVDEVNRLNTVVSQFLDYARPFELHSEQTDLQALVERVLGLVRAEGLPPDVQLVLESPQPLPLVGVDADKVRQVLLNLVHNALHAIGDKGRVTLTLGLGVLHRPPNPGRNAVAIEVRDTGSGIAREDLESLFIPFFTTKRDGTGLGLAISRRLVEAHGGEIAVQSTADEGLSFTVRLPLSD